MNILAYADDLVVLVPSWHPLQSFLNVLYSQSILTDIKLSASCLNLNDRAPLFVHSSKLEIVVFNMF